jgi:coenzyme F420-reducing hydrogenase gamma subunit
MTKNKKLKVAIISLTCCEGCEFALLDLGQRFFTLTEKIDWHNFRLIKEGDRIDHFDLVFVEGGPTTDSQTKTLQQFRKNSDYLVVLGNCAAMGGIQEIKNYRDKNVVIKNVYNDIKNIPNQKIVPVGQVVKVDAILPGCPINAEDFLRLINNFLVDKKFKIVEKPACYECQINEFECLLQKGQPCFGPWTKSGCGAVCLKSGQPCWGCWGLLKNTDQDHMKKILNEITASSTNDKILQQAEVFGLRDEIE